MRGRNILPWAGQKLLRAVVEMYIHAILVGAWDDLQNESTCIFAYVHYTSTGWTDGRTLGDTVTAM